MSEWAAKRFWTDVTVAQAADGFAIRLDDRPVRTPAKQALLVPTEEMAEKIAGEWQAQIDVIDPGSMPWTRSANAAIDKVALQRAEVVAHLGSYADTDLLLYRADGPKALVDRQSALWDPVLDWIDRQYGVKLDQTIGIMPVLQSKEALAALTDLMTPMSDFQITAFHDLVSLSGSYALALAVVERQYSPENAWNLSRVDEDWQIEQWGEDEEANEVARIKKLSFFHAAEFFWAS